MAGWKDVIGVAAPAIATALGGPFAGMATTAICGFLGLKEGSSEREITNAMNSLKPEQLAELRRIDAEFNAKMLQANVDLAAIAQRDRESARELAKADGGNFQRVLTVLALVMLVGLIAAVYFVPAQNEFIKQTLTLIIGTVLGLVGTSYAFYFGTSTGSQQKDKTIQTLSAE